MITETKNKMIATVKMIFAISMEMTATPPKPKTPAINATIRKVRAQPNMKRSSALTVLKATRKNPRTSFRSLHPVTHSRVIAALRSHASDATADRGASIYFDKWGLRVSRSSYHSRKVSPLDSTASADRTPASVCDPDTLNDVYRAAWLSHGLRHDRGKVRLHKAREHLDWEAMRHEQVFGKATRSACELFEGTALFTTDKTHRGCGRLPA
jgi:hypothetical protein